MNRLVIDCSNRNPIDAAHLRSAAPAALICKATEGSSFRDKTLPLHRRLAASARIPFGSYLYLHAGSPGDEAAFYLNYAEPRPGDIQPIIDAEVIDNAGMGQTAARVQSCALELEANGYKPLLYTYASFWQGLYSHEPELKRLRVWEAGYPGGFTRWVPALERLRIRLGHGASVVMWQWTDKYPVGNRLYDASRLFSELGWLLIPEGV